MVFAMLIAAILWNLGTWFMGIPASSSHTLIGSILGVGIMNYLLHSGAGASGIDMEQVMKVGKALLFSPILHLMLTTYLFSSKCLNKTKKIQSAVFNRSVLFMILYPKT
ncbi:hypothetical protein SDC9_182814 [bioreactor metagenome]|uniref:Low-affinity inorganic phosphate transporter 1 n=1 Tax=bioreactor metagenome TaxID=1076179 RepID=A0A645H8E9_9ZZZZ